MRFRQGHGESGFSLIELMIAMTITLIVTGAIYGFIAGGQSAFRVQPERSDRQQNARTAMDAILRDIASAGSGAPLIVQTFTPGLDGATNPDPTKWPSPFGGFSDELEIITNPTNFPPELACGTEGGLANPRDIFLQRNSTLVPAQGRTILISLADGTWTMKTIDPGVVLGNPPAGAAPCDAGATHMHLTFNNNGDLPGFNRDLCAAPPPGKPGNSDKLPGCMPAGITLAEQVRYRIRPGPDGVPNLERRTTAAFASGFQVVARGIEDLQARYVQANMPAPGCSILAPCDNAPLVTLTANPPATGDYNMLITQVTVTLSARSALQRIQGQTNAPAGPAALRGSLTSTGTPRAALFALTQETVNVPLGIPKWH